MGWNQHEETERTPANHGKTARGTGHNPQRRHAAVNWGVTKGSKIGAFYVKKAQERKFREAYLNG